MESTKSDSIQCPVFSGKPEDYGIWWTRFKAFAAVKEFSPIIRSGETRHPDLPGTYADGEAIDPDAGSDAADIARRKRLKKVWKANNMAMAYFALSFKSPELIG